LKSEIEISECVGEDQLEMRISTADRCFGNASAFSRTRSRRGALPDAAVSLFVDTDSIQIPVQCGTVWHRGEKSCPAIAPAAVI
jgi:hypothetical protein